MSLWRNREFTLLWTSQTLSDLGHAMSLLALPLLVLALTGDPVLAGVVGTAIAVTRLLVRLPAGVLADRVDRRRAMIVCDIVRVVALAGLTVAVLLDAATMPVILVVAVLDAAGGALFSTLEHAALPSIVPRADLSTAVARNEARAYAATLGGPPLGGLLFGIAHALPFGANVVTYLLSLAGILLIRKPLQTPRDRPPGRHLAELTEGFRYVFGRPFLRAVLLVAAPLNLALTGAIFAIVLGLQRIGTPPAIIGLAETVVAVGGLLGALAAPWLNRRLSLAGLVRLICWLSAGLIALAAPLSSSLAAAVPVAVALFLGPACNAALFGYQAATTPDHLQGRVISVIYLVATSASAAAPMVTGLLAKVSGAGLALLVWGGVMAAGAVAAVLARGLRDTAERSPVRDSAPPRYSADEQQAGR